MKYLSLRTFVQIALVGCLIVAFTSGVTAFDGNRKGFILGGGLGLGLDSYTQTVEAPDMKATSDRENKFAFMTDFMIGAGASEQVLIYYFNKVSWFSLENVLGENVTIANGVGGAAVRYYFNLTAPSPYVFGGIGLSTWDAPLEEGSDAWYGFGLMFGGGFEFSPHWSVEGDIMWGKPSKEESGVEASSNAISLRMTFGGLAY
ncbi:MAG: hypothetical protein AB1744_04155 [Candidatus Zixiibacteriota bacterium]